MRTSGPRGARSPRAARALTGIHALAALVAFGLMVFARHPGPPGPGERIFGLLNIPVAPSFVSVVTLALVTRALVGRKRIGLWLVAFFQVIGIYLGLLALLPPGSLMITQLWRTRGSLGRGLDIAGIAIGLIALWWLWTLRPLFRGRLQRGSWWLALAALGTGSVITGGVTWLLLGGTHSPRGQLDEVVDTVLAAFGGVSRRVLVEVPHPVVDVTAVLAGVTILATVGLFLASSKPRNRWSPDREVELRALLATHGAADSLGYFATRRDKASVFAPDRRAAVTYRVVAGVSLASADPIGLRASWPAAIRAWQAEAREFGWLPAVLAASEAGAKAYAAAGLRVVLIGDEAVLETDRFNLRTTSRSDVRHAVEHARREGISVRVRRQSRLAPEELRHITRLAHDWLDGQRDRGFSMALGRAGDPADQHLLYVTAHDRFGELVGVLGFVPWGRTGLSLDVMRRSPRAPNGVTELMVTELMSRSRQLGIRRVSLNFCMFRGVFEESARIGGRSLTRLNANVLGFFDRFWQLERLYRSNERYEPTWVPRFVCYDDTLAVPQVAFAAGAAEGFIPWPQVPSLASRELDPARLRRIASLTSSPVPPQPRRSDQSRHRLAVLDRARREGWDPYPAASTTAGTTSLVDLLARPWTCGSHVSVVGRVTAVRDHGGVVFADLAADGLSTQAILDVASATRGEVDRFVASVATGDLVRVDGVTGRSRSGSPGVIGHSWRLEAKSLHPIPFRSRKTPSTWNTPNTPNTPKSRVRQRSLDLIVNPGQVELLRHRSAVVSSVRHILIEEGFLEVETPVLQAVHGGASARPFETTSNAYGTRLSLRIAPELYLKRLVVAGVGPVFELGRSFRNEGVDATHNPEFTSLEAYQPHGDYTTMRHLTESLVRAAARAVHGREVIPLPEPGRLRTGLDGVALVDVSRPWPVVDVLTAVSRAVDRRISMDTELDVLLRVARHHDVDVHGDVGPGAVIEELYSELVEPTTVEPTFYVDFPSETSPLTRPHRGRPGLAERWDLVVAGMEIGTAYTELTDPIEQRARLTAQSLKAAAGDPEAMQLDEDFLQALELGMPPTGGLGIGIDRLVMLLTNTSIRSVIAFPFARPRSSTADATAKVEAGSEEG